MQGFGEAIEQMTRFAAYVTSRDMGKDIKDAVNDAKELTVNFNRKGSGEMGQKYIVSVLRMDSQ